MDKSLEKAAADGKILPKGLTAADSAEYIGLVDSSAHLDRTAPGTHVQPQLRSEAEFLSRESLALEERITAATEAYTADKNLDTAEELYRAFYHLPPKR